MDSQKAVPVIHKTAFPDPFSFQSVTAPSPRVGVAAPGDRRWTGATPPFCCPERARGRGAIHIGANAPSGGRSRPKSPCGKARTMGKTYKCHTDAMERDSMKWPHAVLVLAGSGAVIWSTRYDPRAGLGTHRALRAPTNSDFGKQVIGLSAYKVQLSG